MSWWSTLLAERRHVPVAEFASAVVTRVGAGAAGNEGGDGPYVSHAAGAAVPSSGASADRVARLTAAIDATFRSSSRKRKPGISNTDYTLLTAWFGCKDGGGLARFERRLVSVLREGTCEPHPYYMGEAERDDTKGLIKKNGDFLVRASNNKNKLVVVYGAVEKGKVRMRNVLVSSPGEGGYGFEVKGVDVAGAGGGEDRVCETIHELTVYHQARLVRAVGHSKICAGGCNGECTGVLARAGALDPAQRDVLLGEVDHLRGGGGDAKGADVVGEIADILEDLHEQRNEQGEQKSALRVLHVGVEVCVASCATHRGHEALCP